MEVNLTNAIKKYIDEIDGHNWWCEITTSDNWTPKKCNFPFKLNGTYYFQPFRTREGDKKCIAIDNIVDQEFREDQLVPCSPCSGNKSSRV